MTAESAMCYLPFRTDDANCRWSTLCSDLAAMREMMSAPAALAESLGSPETFNVRPELYTHLGRMDAGEGITTRIEGGGEHVSKICDSKSCIVCKPLKKLRGSQK
jgi:hypothetical protein